MLHRHQHPDAQPHRVSQAHTQCDRRARSAHKRQRGVSTCAAAAAPAAADAGTLLPRLAYEPDASQQSGQAGSSAFDEPLTGCASPLGATYLPEQVG